MLVIYRQSISVPAANRHGEVHPCADVRRVLHGGSARRVLLAQRWAQCGHDLAALYPIQDSFVHFSNFLYHGTLLKIA
jgi:hypothetical protein